MVSLKITVIGWYGTETIGDRAILAGLFSFFKKAYGPFEIHLGSLYPFFTERTINEDYSFYKELIQQEIIIKIFNSKRHKELNKAIKESDLLVMGGGPLMDLNELFMIEYAFKKAQKLGVSTALLGCGVGPLFKEEYRKSVLEISKHSDLIILRDTVSKTNMKEIYQAYDAPLDPSIIYTSYDPAVECALIYNSFIPSHKQKYIAVNLRNFPIEYNKNGVDNNINKKLEIFIDDLSDKYYNIEIRLIPMHYFHIGNDDRAFLNDIALKLKKSNIIVQNVNLTLKETMQMFQNAYLTIGMRFHSVVLQTIINGRNYVLDYTEPNRGKISGFLKDIDNNGFYDKRYISLQKDHVTIDIIKSPEKAFQINNIDIEKQLQVYVRELKVLSQ